MSFFKKKAKQTNQQPKYFSTQKNGFREQLTGGTLGVKMEPHMLLWSLSSLPY